MGVNDFILDGMRWSFSSVNTYDTCPQAFKLGYLDALPKVGNAFSDWGTFMHSLMERYLRGEVEFFELLSCYDDGIGEAMQHEFPPNRFCDLAVSYNSKGRNYLAKFEGLFDGCEILGIEQRVRLDIEGRPFVGVIDLLVKDGEDIYVVDHKSKSDFKTKKELEKYARQLYLYSLYVHEKYGKWPTKLIFHMIRKEGEQVSVPFTMEGLEEAKRWFLVSIDKIYSDADFISQPNAARAELAALQAAQKVEPIPFADYTKRKKRCEAAVKANSFYCNYLCGVRDHCPDKDKAPKES